MKGGGRGGESRDGEKGRGCCFFLFVLVWFFFFL